MSTAVEQIVKPYHQTDRFSLYEGDCRIVLPCLADCSVDSIVCDPPYELGFMGKGWDRSGIAYDVSVWSECLRVLKPGGHLLAFGGSRTYHRLACAIEDAGFEIRDQIQWIYGSGFPKSLDVGKAIDGAEGLKRARVPNGRAANNHYSTYAQDEWTKANYNTRSSQEPLTDRSKQWNGWGTALKPAHEPIVLARKPLIGTVAQNVLEHGTGGLNIDGCRIEPTGERLGGGSELPNTFQKPDGWDRPWMHDPEHVAAHATKVTANVEKASEFGRWPSNVIHDGSEEVLAGFPETASGSGDKHSKTQHGNFFKGLNPVSNMRQYESDSGPAARFFYCAKASKEDREAGLDGVAAVASSRYGEQGQGPEPQQTPRKIVAQRNHHPTVKPTELMRYLCRLVTPPGGIVLDPFCGSGSTGKGAMLEGLKFVGIELSAEYCELAQRRIEAVTRQGLLFG